MGTFGFIEIILMLVILCIVVLLPLIALIDILKSKFQGNDAILMALIVIFVPLFGPIIYFVLAPSKKIKNQ
jgi:hypothetical protein